MSNNLSLATAGLLLLVVYVARCFSGSGQETTHVNAENRQSVGNEQPANSSSAYHLGPLSKDRIRERLSAIPS